ncbi:16S rRNA (guanine(966)-N(2))-methyltransferase RsmD [bacterium]|nr:16S rRNA (guanine(966)-N(2))-methyltransferase RsmD [bacterium]
MKIIGGKLKGRNLLFLKNKNLRPSKDIVRESVFDVLRGSFENENVLDLFAGTGAMGIEAFSQGAKEVVFIENSYEACRIIKKNLDNLGISTFCTVVKGSVEKSVDKFEDVKFGLVLADPPYNYSEKRVVNILSSIVAKGIIKKDGTIVVEHGKHIKFSSFEGLNLYKEKKYGRSFISYFRC